MFDLLEEIDTEAIVGYSTMDQFLELDFSTIKAYQIGMYTNPLTYYYLIAYFRLNPDAICIVAGHRADTQYSTAITEQGMITGLYYHVFNKFGEMII